MGSLELEPEHEVVASAPAERLALVFPGQGSQTDGMRQTVERFCPDLLALATEVVGEDPFPRCEAGTRFAQPALYCAALAAWERLGRPVPAMAAGHSLGEIAALVAADSLPADVGLRLVAARGRLMQEAADAHPPNGMLAVMGDDRAGIQEVAERCRVAVANDNAPRQVVLAGTLDDLGRAEQELGARGLRGVHVPVSGAFHSPLMQSAVAPLKELLAAVDFRPPRFPVLAGATAAPFEAIAETLAEAVVRPVRWRQVLLALRQLGATRVVETGPGRVLTALTRRTLDGVVAETGDSLEALAGA